MSEGDFKANYSKNPPNLLSDCEYRNRPQPRYRLHEDHLFITPQYKYVEYKRCLPGSVAIKSDEKFNVSIVKTFGDGKIVNSVVNDRYDYECKAFDVQNCSDAANCKKTPTPLSLQEKPSRSVNSQGKI